MSFVLGLDIGTTSTIGILLELPDRIVATASRPVTLSSPHPGWAEEDPEQWWRNVTEITREIIAVSGIKPDAIDSIGVTGMLEAIFIEDGYEGAAMPGRPVPAVLTYALIEGFLLQSMIQGTGLAMLELEQKILAPVQVGDTIGATVEVTGIRPTSRKGRAVVDSQIDVYNQHGTKVMSYRARRLLAGRKDAVGG